VSVATDAGAAGSGPPGSSRARRQNTDVSNPIRGKQGQVSQHLSDPSGAVMRSAGGSMTLNDSVYERLLRERIIVLGQQVDDAIANQISAQLLLLAAEDDNSDITLYINSPGGSVSAGMAIFDTMELIKPDVSTVVMGLAASMGQFLATAGAAGKRYALPHSQIMMHQPLGGLGGTETDITIRAESMRKLKRQLAELIAERSGQTVEKITEDSDRDRWFDPDEAVEYGLIDRVISRASGVGSSSNGNGTSA
jgi:ATP-dependent Clp protease, protease subunit